MSPISLSHLAKQWFSNCDPWASSINISQNFSKIQSFRNAVTQDLLGLKLQECAQQICVEKTLQVTLGSSLRAFAVTCSLLEWRKEGGTRRTREVGEVPREKWASDGSKAGVGCESPQDPVGTLFVYFLFYTNSLVPQKRFKGLSGSPRVLIFTPPNYQLFRVLSFEANAESRERKIALRHSSCHSEAAFLVKKGLASRCLAQYVKTQEPPTLVNKCV